MKKNLRGPDFFMVGFPKCGTTAMADFLGQHPEVYFSKPKESNFFASDIFPSVKKKYKNTTEYLRHFFPDVSSKHKAVGDGSIRAIYSERGIERILDYCSDAKFIVMMRNPVDAAISCHGHALRILEKNERELCNDFEQCWKQMPQRRLGKKLPVICEAPLFFRYGDTFLYFQYIEKLFFKVKDRKRIHVIVYDDFKKSPIREYKKVCQFLEVSTKFKPKLKIVNQRSRVNIKWYISLFVLLNRSTYKVRQRFGLASLGILDKILARNQVLLEEPEISSEFLAEMKSFFQEDIIKTSKLINRDLSMWL